MKSLIFPLFFLLSTNILLAQDCLPDGITFSSQAEIDQFVIDYPDCTHILGDVRIENFPDSLTSLAALSQLTSIRGNLEVKNAFTLSSFSGLDSLTSVGEDLIIDNVQHLTDLTGLNNLATVGGHLKIEKNENLETLSGLEALTSIGETLLIFRNPALLNLSGLSNLSYIADDLNIYYNNALESLMGLEGLNAFDGALSIRDNLALQSLSGLGDFHTISNLLISENSALQDLSGLEMITAITGALGISENASLKNLNGLDNLHTIGLALSINENSALESLSGLEALASIGSALMVLENNVLEDLTGLDNLTTIGSELKISNNNALKNLNGLESLIYVGTTPFLSGYFTISNNPALINFSGLDNLTLIASNMHIENNAALVDFTGLAALNYVGLKMVIENNPSLVNFSGMSSLDSTGTWISVEGNASLEDFTGLDQLETIGSWFYVKNNPSLLNMSGLNSLKTIAGSFSLIENSSIESLSGMESLTTLGAFINIENNASLIDLSGLENLSAIKTYFLIAGNPLLQDLSGLRNASLNSTSSIEIVRNDELSLCGQENICNYLVNGGRHNIDLNASGCNTAQEILLSCHNLSRIKYDVFYDLNQNGVHDVDEPYFPDAVIDTDPIGFGALLDYHFNEDGIIFLQEGNYSLTYNEPANTPWSLTTDSSSFDITLNDLNMYEYVYFGMFPDIYISDVISSIAAQPTRCDRPVVFDINVKNKGTSTASGYIWLEIDENLYDINYIDQPDSIVGQNLFAWYFEDLYPGYTIKKQFEGTVPGVENFTLGEDLHFSSYVVYDDENGAQEAETFNYASTVLCSFDPNDKLVHPQREGNYTLFDEALIFTIRFQNTGNAAAYDIVIRDTLDANLDISAFKVLGSSHREKLLTKLDQENRTVSFEFKNIYLPGSTSDFNGSQGYVSYVVKPVEGLPEQTRITNSASIYFDTNLPILTNETENILVSMIPESPDDPDEVLIYPNPTSGEIQIIGKNTLNADIQVFDTWGRMAFKEKLEADRRIDLNHLPGGIYFITIQNDSDRITKKIVLAR